MDGGTTETGTKATDAGSTSWVPATDPDFAGYAQSKGWDKLSAPEAAAAAVKSYREAEKKYGAPAEELVRFPKDPVAPEWNGVFERLGKPKDAKEYDFASVKRADGTALNDGLADKLRASAFKLNLTKDAATGIASTVAAFLDGTDATALAEKTAGVATSKAALIKNWGSNFPANQVIAQGAVRALGLEPDTVSKLEGVVGYEKIMEMFRVIGTKIGEDRFIHSGGSHQAVMTRDEAQARITSLKADTDWTTKYLAGGVDQRKEMDALVRIVVGVAA